jgi:exosome complex RNA-binding protein Rrp4
VKYELRGSADVFWKNDKRLVVCRTGVEVVERFAIEEAIDMQQGGMTLKVLETVVVGENGKIWMQGRILSGLVVAGGSACVELQVKNHSAKKVVSAFIIDLLHIYFALFHRTRP